MKNPYFNAVLASLYIVGIVLLIHTFEFVGKDKPDTILAPMVMISLLVLSASLMGFLFFFRPMQMFLEGEKQQAVTFFFQTFATFGVFTAILVLITFVVLR